jgi:hypothetical protein
MDDKMPRFAPYEMLTPGFEAVFTGERRAVPDQDTDEHGNVIGKWPVWTWQWDEAGWDETISHINRMQETLGPLDHTTRRLRAEIGAFVPCDSSVPVSIDELLRAIGEGHLPERAFRKGCWPGAEGWRSTQPQHIESMATIETILRRYLAGESQADATKRFPQAASFIDRTYEWLGPVAGLTNVQKKMMDRMLLTIDVFAETSVTVPIGQSLNTAEMHDMESLGKDLFPR